MNLQETEAARRLEGWTALYMRGPREGRPRIGGPVRRFLARGVLRARLLPDVPAPPGFDLWDVHEVVNRARQSLQLVLWRRADGRRGIDVEGKVIADDDVDE